MQADSEGTPDILEHFRREKRSCVWRKILFCSANPLPSFRGLRFPAREMFSMIVRRGDYVQTHSAYLYVAELKNPPIVVDIGTYHGVYAILLRMLAQHKKSKVVAVEPNPPAFEILQENIRLNNLEDIVKCENVAIMGRTGTFAHSLDR